MKQINRDTKLLPIVKFDGTEFIIDIERRQFRDFRKPDDIVAMHSERGRKMVRDMHGNDLRSWGLLTGTIDKTEV